MADKQWGVYDIQDNCWIGNDAGPKVFDDFTVARIAAEVCADQLGYELHGRLEAREYVSGNVRLRDEIPTKRSPLKALQRIEDGLV